MSFLAIEPVTLMLSSRCKDRVRLDDKLQPMAQLRVRIKKAIEDLRLDGEQVFEAWIHEDESVAPGDQDSWQTCIAKAKRADIVLVLYNGRAGWPGTEDSLGGEIGICHAEFAAAFDSAPRKLRTVQIQPIVAADAGSIDERFQKYFAAQGLLGAQATTGEEAIAHCKGAAIAALLDLARSGVGVGKRASHYSGEALAWSRMDFATRRATTTAVLSEALGGQATGDRIVLRDVQGQVVAFVCDCIPAAMSTAAARELVGQPFLQDHRIVASLTRDVVGPVHVIACHRGVTEGQALRQLGFPEAVVVATPFGVYAVDDVQKMQMVFIANCRDETTTRNNTQEFLRWIQAQGEDRRLAARAAARRRISEAIGKEQAGTELRRAPTTRRSR